MTSDQHSDVDLPDAADLVEMAETVTVLHAGLDMVGRCVERPDMSDGQVSDVEQAAAWCADDEDFVAAWQRASRRARIEALTTVASLAAQTTAAQTTAAGITAVETVASLRDLPPDDPAGALVACAVEERRVPVPASGAGLLGPLTGPTAASAAALVRGGGGDRDQRVVFAVLGLHVVTADTNPPLTDLSLRPPRGRHDR
jgi:hypothetical protein